MVRYKSYFISIKNSKSIDKPNEDYCLCDDKAGIYLLVDGVSRDKINGVYPNPSPALDVSKKFVKSVYEYILTRVDDNTDIINELHNAIKYGNDEIKKYNCKKQWINNFFPGTVGIITIIRRYKLFIAYIGDCYGLIVNTDKCIFTKCQTENIAKHKEEFTAYEIRNKICNNKSHPYSYGVLNGDNRALDFVNYEVIDLKKGDKILICSDGFSDVVNNFPCKSLYDMTIEQMVKVSNNSDDKTMVVIEVNK